MPAGQLAQGQLGRCQRAVWGGWALEVCGVVDPAVWTGRGARRGARNLG
jgi:hypothetical protein